MSRKFGRCATVVNIDPPRGVRVRKNGTADVVWEVHINGGRVPTGLEAVAWAREVEGSGAGEIVLTSMDADGTKERLRPGDDAGRLRGGERSRSSPAAGRAPRSTCGRRSRPGPTPPWPPASSTPPVNQLFRTVMMHEASDLYLKAGQPG